MMSKVRRLIAGILAANDDGHVEQPLRADGRAQRGVICDQRQGAVVDIAAITGLADVEIARPFACPLPPIPRRSAR